MSQTMQPPAFLRFASHLMQAPNSGLKPDVAMTTLDTCNLGQVETATQKARSPHPDYTGILFRSRAGQVSPGSSPLSISQTTHLAPD